MKSAVSPAPRSREFVHPERPLPRSRNRWDLPVGAAVCVLVSLLALGFVSGVYSDVDTDKERVFLDQKIQTLLLEVRTLARTSASIDELHAWDDGSDLVPSLSLQKRDGDWLAPSDPFSGNRVVGNQWLYARRLNISRLPGPGREALRLAKIELFRFEKKKGYVPVRESRQVLGAGPTYEDAARSVDLYVLAIENCPLAWTDPNHARARFESRLLDFEARNPGIRFRTHWITRLAYGRASDDQPDAEGQALRVRVADAHHPALRLPAERRLFERRVQAGLEDAEEPTWRLLLEDLHARPEQYRDAVILNLHGATLPLPPLCNQSDAARIPVRDPGLRVVCHPEKLRFEDGRRGGAAEDVRLRVYAWRQTSQEGSDPLDHPIVLRLPGLDLRAPSGEPDLHIEFLAGGRQADGSLASYAPFTKARPWSGERGDPGYELRYVPPGGAVAEGYTEVRLHGTPTSCPRVGEGGLDREARLHGWEYIPLPVEGDADFSQDLAAPGKGPKNTARWSIRIPASRLRSQMGERTALEIQTSIGGGDRVEPGNLSRTWTWWTSDLEAVPITERFQFMGDPRHNPYADLCDVGESYPSAYNWFFDDLRSDGQDLRNRWPSIGSVGLRKGWMGRGAEDLPRFFLVLRQALRRSHALFVQGPGPLAFAVSYGGADGAGTRNSGFEGSTSLMNSGEEWATFHHQKVASQTSRWTEEGQKLIHRWSLETGPAPKLLLPFRLKTSWHGSVGPEWPWRALYPRQKLGLVTSYLEHDRGALGLALVSAREPGQEGEARYLLNGLDPRTDFDGGLDLLLATAVESLLRGQKRDAGLLPVPRIERAEFLAGSRIQLVYDLDWPRESTAQGGRRLEPLEERVRYRCLYSPDGGRTWHRLEDGITATPDRPRSDPKEWIPDSRIGPETHVFEMSSTIETNGVQEWIIRVEAWIEGRRLHHAYHQQRIVHGS